MKKQIAYLFQMPKLDLMSLKMAAPTLKSRFHSKTLQLWPAVILALFLVSGGLFAAEVETKDAGLAKSKYITGTLDRSGAVVITKEQIAIPGLNYTEPNFLVQAYIQSRDYWVVARLFIGPDGLTIESSRNFSGKKFRIVIVY